MTEAVEVALITSSVPLIAIIISRVLGSAENRKTNQKIDSTKTTTDKIAGELTPNGGNSVKDLITKSVEQGVKAATVAAAAKESVEKLQRTLDEKLELTRQRMAKAEEEVKDLKLRFERKLVHDGRGDSVSTTRLFKEAEEYLEKVDREAREAKAAQERAGEQETAFD